MRAPHFRIAPFFAGLVLLIIAVASWYVLRPAVPLASEVILADVTGAPLPSVPEPTAAPVAAMSAPVTGVPLAPDPTRTVGPKKIAYQLKGAVQGVALPARAPAVREGAEKGRVMEINGMSVANLETLVSGQTISLPTPEGELNGIVNLVQKDENGWVRVGGSISGRAGSFTLASSAKMSGGLVLLPNESRAYQVRTEPSGKVLMVERRISDVACVMYTSNSKKSVTTDPARGSLAATTSGTSSAIVASATPPLLSSRPNAPAVVYLDFDGETVTDPAWNNGVTIVAPAYPLTSAQITEIFNRVKEDYAAFNIDITTSLARYNAVAANRRTHCIITSNDAAAPGAGGVAYVDGFSTAGTSFSSTLPCWVFNDSVIGIAEAASHEVGHALGLSHDGRSSPVEEYYSGAGTGATGWAPIMGVGYDRLLVQWSKGEYKAANNKEDDLALISRAANGFGYITDEAGGTTAAAAALSVSAGVINQAGVISGNADVDFFQFTSLGGAVSVTVNPAAISPDLDLLLELRNSVGTVLSTSNPVATLPATISMTLPAGTYYLKVAGTGKGDVLVDGYTSYGSVGAYTLSGSIAGVASVPSITSAAQATGQVGNAFSYQITASNSPTSFGLTGTLPSGVIFDSSSGLISGTPSAAGSFSLTMSATNAQGTGTMALALTVSSATVTLAEAIDLVGPTVTTSGNAGWSAQSAVTFDSVDAAVSGVIADSQTSSLQVDLTGPVTLGYRWKVDSEAMYDKLCFVLDGVISESISGSTDWALRSFSVPSGLHHIEWRYVKDASVSAGADAGWVDTVTVNSPGAQRLAGDLSFAKIAVASTATRTFMIYNDGGAAITVSGITYPTGFTGAWSGQIAAGSSQDVVVTFAPIAAQVYSGNVTVISDAASGATTLPISGEGTSNSSGPTVLANNSPVTGLSGATASQKFYKISVPTESRTLTVKTSGGTGDLDLYIKYGSAPSTSIFALKSDGSTCAESVTVNNPTPGDWYILIDGYAAFSGASLIGTVQGPLAMYTVGVSAVGNGTVTGDGNYATGTVVTARATAAAGNGFVNWSENGVVVSTAANYTFTIAANRTLVATFRDLSVLFNNVPVSNLAGVIGSQMVYSIVVPSGMTRMTVTTSLGRGDVDLYLKRGAPPSVSSYDYKSDGPTNAGNIAVLRPAAGTWYILLQGYAAYSGARLTVLMTAFANPSDANVNPSIGDVLAQMSGSYQGLIGGDVTYPVVLGQVRFRLTAAGAFSCKAILDGVPQGISGHFDTNGLWSGFMKSHGVLVPLALALDQVGQAQITGTLTLPDSVQSVTALRTASGAAEQFGVYHFDLPPDTAQTGVDYPQSTGSAVLSVKKTGVATVIGILGDGTRFLSSANLSISGDLPLYSPVYHRGGSIGGWLLVHSASGIETVDGSLHWIKPAIATDVLFPAGFNGEVLVSGTHD